MKKQIVFVDQSLDVGGAERVLVTIMRNLNPKEFKMDLIIISEIKAFAHLVPDYVTVHNLGIKKTRNSLIPFIKKINKLSPDIVFSTTHRISILTVISRYFSKKYKIISRYPTMPKMEIVEGRLKGWRLLLVKYFYKKVNLIISQTDEMKKQIVEVYGIDIDKIVTLMNPIDTILIDESIKGENPFNSRYINVIASGTIYPVKGFDILIKSAKKVLEKNNKFMFHIIGKDYQNEMSILMKLAEKLNIKDRIIFYGFQKNPYLFYKYSDLFVLSSRREGLPNVLLECQYLGKPIVATSCVPIISTLLDKNSIVSVEDIDEMSNVILNYTELRAEKIYRKSEIIEIFKNI